MSEQTEWANDSPIFMLKNIRVAITRPEHQAESLCRLVEAAGEKAIRFPAIKLRFIGPDEALKQRIIADLKASDMAIFISANAVEGANKLLQQNSLPEQIMVAAVGKSTAIAIEQHWQRQVLVPQHGFDSEGLLALPALRAVAGKKIIIFRGQNGRELLAKTLKERGALVHYIEVYQRYAPNTTLDQLRQKKINVICATSNEGLKNLYNMAGEQDRDWLLSQPLAVIGQRTAQAARALGFKKTPTIAASADDQGLLSAILAWKHAG